MRSLMNTLRKNSGKLVMPVSISRRILSGPGLPFSLRPGLAIGRRGTGIKDLTERVAAKFALPNPHIVVSEAEAPELNPTNNGREDGSDSLAWTAFRRAATWTMNSIMAAGASGVEIGVAGKLRSDRSHSEKYRMGVVPKSGEASKQVVRECHHRRPSEVGIIRDPGEDCAERLDASHGRVHRTTSRSSTGPGGSSGCCYRGSSSPDIPRAHS